MFVFIASAIPVMTDIQTVRLLRKQKKIVKKTFLTLYSFIDFLGSFFDLILLIVTLLKVLDKWLIIYG